MADAAAVHLVNHILADNNARAGTFGLDSALATRGFAAVKSGTSKDLRDNWCIGFTDRYTVGVWVGNASGDACGQRYQQYQRRRAGVACAGASAACRPAVAGAPLPPPGVETSITSPAASSMFWSFDKCGGT